MKSIKIIRLTNQKLAFLFILSLLGSELRVRKVIESDIIEAEVIEGDVIEAEAGNFSAAVYIIAITYIVQTTILRISISKMPRFLIK